MDIVPTIQGDDLNLILQICSMQLKSRFTGIEVLNISNELQSRGYERVKVTIEGIQGKSMVT